MQHLTATGMLLVATSSLASGGTDAFDKGMEPILNAYLQIQAALVDDTDEGVQASARTIEKLAGKIDASSVTGDHAGHYENLSAKLAAGAKAVAAAKGLSAVREAFKELSKPMAMWGTMSKPKGIDVVFCSMAKGSWLQKRAGGIRNPYHGKSMLTCGEVVGGDGHHASHRGH